MVKDFASATAARALAGWLNQPGRPPRVTAVRFKRYENTATRICGVHPGDDIRHGRLCDFSCPPRSRAGVAGASEASANLQPDVTK